MTISNNYPTIRPTLLLDFANTEQLDPRISFSRPTTATYYDGKTTVKAEENLVRYSQGTGMAANWGADSGGTSTRTDNYAVAPDGTTTAMRFVTTNANFPNMSQNITVAAGTYTLSFWASVPSGTLVIPGGTFPSPGTATTTWQRFTSTGTLSATSTIYLFNFGAPAALGIELLIWGVQLEQRSTVTSYTATTTAPITNYTPVLLTAPVNEARFDHNPTTGESLGLLIEEPRTNLAVRSSELTNASWSKSNLTIDGNVTIAPDGTQTVQLITATTTAANVYQVTVGLAAGTYSMSVYLKRGNVASVTLGIVNVLDAISYNFDTGAIGGLAASTGVATNVGNGWIRLSFSYACSAGNFGPAIKILTAGGTVFAWGVQFELGAFATSYIPTTLSQVTRSADLASMNGTNFSSWYNAQQGSIYVDAVSNFGSAANWAFLATLEPATGAVYTNMLGIRRTSNTTLNTFVDANGAAVNLGGAASAPAGAIKVAVALSAGSYAQSINGATAATSATPTAMIPNINRLGIGYYTGLGNYQLNGTIKKISYYPIRVTNAQLQALTGN